MSNYEEQSNNEILLELQQMKVDHEAEKIEMLKHFDILEAIEKRFKAANDVLYNRLSGKVQ